MMIARMLLVLMALQTADAEIARIEEWAKTQPDNGPGRMAVGDEYWKAARKFPKDRLRFADRASESWAAGWPLLQDVWKDKVRQSFRKMFAAPGAVAPLAKIWTSDGAAASPERVRSGRFAARIPMARDGALRHALKATFAVPPGVKSIDVAAWFLTDETESVEDNLKVIAYATDGKVLAVSSAPVAPDVPVWRRAFTSVAVDGAARVVVFIEFKSSKGVAFVDDVEIKAGDKVLFR